MSYSIQLRKKQANSIVPSPYTEGGKEKKSDKGRGRFITTPIIHNRRRREI
jgi:hypothetical protein